MGNKGQYRGMGDRFFSPLLDLPMRVGSMEGMSRLRGRARECWICCWERREALLALALGLWLFGFWAAQDGWHHRRALILLVPFLLFGMDRMLAVARTVRWLWAVTLLVGWQTLSRVWGEPPLVPAGGTGDSVWVVILGVALVVVGRRGALAVCLIGGLAVLGAAVTAYSLWVFYGDPAHDLAIDRFRNVLVYSEGLNPVLTGMLCSSAAVAAGWFALRSSGWKTGLLWTAVLVVLVFGLMASQSRGAMLGFVVGFGALLLFEWRSCHIALVPMVLSVAVYFIAVQGGNAAGELIERGSTGRLAIYQWFLDRLSGLEFLTGRGFGTLSEIPEEELGWLVHHPHSSYLTQLVLGGLVGMGLLLLVLFWSIRDSLRLGALGQSLWAPVLACGLGSLLFDGAEIFSLHSVPRLEFLLVVVPACLLAGQASARLPSPGKALGTEDKTRAPEQTTA
ncbi:MAG: hypothetical protein CMO35_01405 [Verrucomicrobiaceae bacterium]|nr:hypothetical protein [Verrucomicrobiaceae bacterium]